MPESISIKPDVTQPGADVLEVDAQQATVAAVKATNGQLFGYHIYNSNTAVAFVHFYDIPSGRVTVGTSARKITLAVPPGGGVDGVFPMPITFTTAMAIAATTTITGSTNPTTGLLVDIFFA